jgi:hypothetical protein
MKGLFRFIPGGTREMKLPSVEEVNSRSAEPARTFKGFIENLAVQHRVIEPLARPVTSKQTLRAVQPALIKGISERRSPPRPPNAQRGPYSLQASSKSQRKQAADTLSISEEDQTMYVSVKR